MDGSAVLASDATIASLMRNLLIDLYRGPRYFSVAVKKTP